MTKLDIETLGEAVTGSAVALRAITRLEPAGGPGDKIFPPTYVLDRGAETKYALEERQTGTGKVLSVLLDSVQSQANRIEQALLAAWHDDDLPFPMVWVDFTQEKGLADLGHITTLDAPHRIADALLRDSLLDGVLFRQTDVGRAFTEARCDHATGMFRFCPTALVFGIWDSTGPKGGLGAKFQRCLVSEIVGHDVVVGVKTSSRIDPAGIEKDKVAIYEAQDPEEGWTLSEDAAIRKGKKPIELRPSEVNHGNIPPSLDRESGGVTISHAIQTTVLSLPGLRRLRFKRTNADELIPPDSTAPAEGAARTALAALALAGVVYQRDNGYDLRSRSLLVPTEPLTIELLGRDGGEPQRFTLDREGARQIVVAAEKAAREHGLGWDRTPIELKPAPKLTDLIRKSRALRAAGEATDD